MTVSDPSATSGPLASLHLALFGPRPEAIHGFWRNLFASSDFSFQEGLTRQERIELSYQRLRIVNSVISDPRSLVTDATALAALHEWVGAVDAGAGTIASIHFNLFLGSLLDHDHAGRDLNPYIRMEKIGTFLCTERAHGNDVSAMETTATFDRAAGDFVLNTPNRGASKWMPNTSSVGGAKDAVVAARLIIDGKDHGVFLFLAPLSDRHGTHLPGVEVELLPEAASSPVDHCSTSFHSVRLPFAALLQADHGRLSPDGNFTSTLGSVRARFLRSIGRVTMGKLCMSSSSLGVTRHALAVAVRHSHDRLTSGMTARQRVPLMAHRSHHGPLLEALATTYAATLLHRSVVRRWTQTTEAERADAERLTAITKGWITWTARQVMTECRERCGGQGLVLANGIAGQLAANEGTITAEGDNLVIWIKAAGEMLMGGFTPQPASEDPPGTRALDDPQHLHDLLADLERIRHDRARTRLRARGIGSPLERWNGTSGPALALVDAHVHRLAAQELLAAAGQASDPQARHLLQVLHRLFVLRYVTAHSGELLAHERLTAEQVIQLPDAVESAVGTLVPHALTLIEAFAVPDELMESHPMLCASAPVSLLSA